MLPQARDLVLVLFGCRVDVQGPGIGVWGESPLYGRAGVQTGLGGSAPDVRFVDMNFPHRFSVHGLRCALHARLGLLGVFAVLLLLGCQNTTAPEETSFSTKFAPLANTTAPDSVNWTFGGKSWTQSVGQDQAEFTVAVQINQRVAKDSLKIELRSLSITTYRLWAWAGAEVAEIEILARTFDSIANPMLIRYDSLHKATPARYPWTHAGAVAFYADLLLSGEKRFAGYPGNCPSGIQTKWVDSLLLSRVLESKDSVGKHLAVWGVTWTPDQIKATYRQWLASGKIRQGQYDTLYPFDDRPPTSVRPLVFTGAKDSNAIQRGSSGVKVEGVFADDTGIVSQKIRIFAKNGDDATMKFTIAAADFPATPQKSWDLAGNLSIKTESAPTDLYTLQIDFADRKNQTITAKLAFYVYPETEAQIPEAVLISPAERVGNVVEFEQAHVLVSWRFKNWQLLNLDSVWIGGSAAEWVDDSTIQKKLELDPTGKNSQILLRAVSRSGLVINDLVEVLRKKDSVGPKVTWLEPAGDIQVGFETKVFKVRVRAVDPTGVDSVSIQGARANALNDSEWTADVELISTGVPTVINAQAWDKNGNRSTASIRVVRDLPPGTSKPVFQLVEPLKAIGNSLPFESPKLFVSYKITDDLGLVDSSVRIDGVLAAKDTAKKTWSAWVPVPATGKPYVIVAEASNIKGNGAVDQITVTRAVDEQAPVIHRDSDGFAAVVPFGKDSVVLAWNVVDNGPMASVSLDGTILSLCESKCSIKRSLAIGLNHFELVAKDSAGNVSLDTFSIVRQKDAVLPKVELKTPSLDTVVDFAVTSMDVGWIVSDNDRITEVRIQGIITSPKDGLHTLRVNLQLGENIIILSAIDATGNKAIDTVRIRRGGDNVKPVVERLPGTNDSAVAFGTKSHRIAWRVSDNDKLGEIHINKKTIVPDASGVVSMVLDLVPGPNRVDLVVKDTSGNTSTDVVVIMVGSDSELPKIVRKPGTHSQTVAHDVDSITVSWQVTDNASVAQVMLNDVLANGAGGIYSRKIALRIGSNKIKIVAQDSALNSASDEITIIRSKLDSTLFQTRFRDTLVTVNDLVSYRLNLGATVGATRLTWSFGDGSADTTQSGPGYSIDHRFPGASTIPVGQSKLFRVKATAINDSGRSLAISWNVRVVNDAPVLQLNKDLVGNVGETVRVGGVATDSGRVVRWEWSMDGKSFRTGSPDSVFALPSVFTLHYPIYARVVDEDGNASNVDTTTVNVYETFTDTRDGRRYKKVTIGTQTWMAENLNYDTLDGVQSFCMNDDAAFCAEYGRFYLFDFALGVRWGRDTSAKDICPEGWRIPFMTEWGVLENYITNNSGEASLALRSKSQWENGNGVDRYGFRALPAGVYYVGENGTAHLKLTEFMEGSSEPDVGYFSVRLEGGTSGVFKGLSSSDAASVRCLRR